MAFYQSKTNHFKETAKVYRNKNKPLLVNSIKLAV